MFIIPCAIVALLSFCLSFLCFGLMVRTQSRPYGLCHRPYTLAHIKGFGSPVLHVYFPTPWPISKGFCTQFRSLFTFLHLYFRPCYRDVGIYFPALRAYIVHDVCVYTPARPSSVIVTVHVT